MTRRARLVIVLVLNVVLVAGLIAVGVTAHSLGVLAAGGDYLADSGAILLALLAISLRQIPPSARRPNGYPHATAYAALVNGILLGLVVAFVTVTALWRLLQGSAQVHGLPVLIASSVAAGVMAVGAVILRGDVDDVDDTDADRANMRAVLLDTVADAAAAAGVAAAGAVILVTGGWFWLDPTVALIIAGVIGYHVVVLLRDVATGLRAPSQT
jgi:cobalt-zinc-cadmium efflux system protein